MKGCVCFQQLSNITGVSTDFGVISAHKFGGIQMGSAVQNADRLIAKGIVTFSLANWFSCSLPYYC